MTTRRAFLTKFFVATAALGLIMGAAATATKYRAICRHGGSRLWRGDIRDTYAAADKDRKKHAETCQWTDNGVIQPGDPGWE